MQKIKRLGLLLASVYIFIGTSAAIGATLEPENPKSSPTASPTGESLSKWPKNATHVIRAEILSVNEDKQEITVKDIATGNQITTRVSDPTTLGSFVRGDHVRVTFASSDTSTATSAVAEENSSKPKAHP
jgi:hypothetical protein